MKRPRPLTQLELEVMKSVWELGGGTVRQVHERIAEHRKIAYTTTMTMMNILVTKGHLTRAPGEGRAYVYTPVHPKGRVISGLVEEFLGRVFSGAARPLVLALLKDRKISRAELDEIARMAEGGS